ncbi:transcriptional regulator [Chromobacterium violaceum]|uniref:winged helix-turn-helix transcriptional regulator n=1 Tax=Chromobacterium violaceum TaxID=536 RepID=UPI0005B9A395|nr:winged helix-turn-helix transcriptional regulator [Chromobacterium violaceum]KMN49699.1 transcriptional regulator [Chromobacterium violaceum]KMN85051.1 transcriptional regulator [Chromobacterium violaceum]KMN89436.1 transcriptional regulator [Chromobacterium violaceum]KMO04886.1 transcriptional regulator [Chromobacterium violaceum]MBP4052141.1 winged helix-turn-helix transcriptional regulator [Chromobacterium violaceum]
MRELAELNFPIDATVRLVGGKWKCAILCHLMDGGELRTGELRRRLAGVSQKVLTEQLRELERDGLVSRTVHPEVPPRVEYRLTELGGSLRPIIDAMCEWGAGYLARGRTGV